MFKGAHLIESLIPYAFLLVGLVYILAVVYCMHIIDDLGRKPLLVYSMLIMLLNFAFLLVIIYLKVTERNMFCKKNFRKNFIFKFKTLKIKKFDGIVSYLFIFWMTVFLTCHAIGLGLFDFKTNIDDTFCLR
jgi:MFS family permease